MLEQARAVNPDAEFHLHDFRQPRPEWQDAWDLVSSMWYAYGYVNTIGEFRSSARQPGRLDLAQGRAVPSYFNLNGLWETHLPHDFPTPFAPTKVFVTGLIWSYLENGKLHQDMIAPMPTTSGPAWRSASNGSASSPTRPPCRAGNLSAGPSWPRASAPEADRGRAGTPGRVSCPETNATLPLALAFWGMPKEPG